MIQYIISYSFNYFQDGEIDLKLLTNVLSPETEVFEVTIMYFAYLMCVLLKLAISSLVTLKLTFI